MDEDTLMNGGEEVVQEPTPTLTAMEILLSFAASQGDISEYLTDEQISRITDQVCDQYDRDKTSRAEWKGVASKALRDMAKTDHGQKNTPWENASNVKYPLLPYAVMQFNARAYPAIVKGDEAVSIKVVGADRGKQAMGPDGQPLFAVQGMPVAMTPQGPVVMTPQGLQPLPEGMQPEPVMERLPGAKAKRAQRVRDYMNTVLFYRMDEWETETDTLLVQMPAIGCGFRKTWFDGEKHQSRFVTALNLVVDNDSKSLDDAPQIAEEIEGVFPHHIKRDMAVGKYRTVDYLTDEDHAARKLIEVQCYYDLDGDGVDEPYIVTIDQKERQLLRVVPDFAESDIRMVDGRVAFIQRRRFYTKYEFLPHPEGKFYNGGLAHLLDQYGEVINTILNQMIDANHAMTAGGGFIASGLRIQGKGQASSLRFRPGEYKTVDVSGTQLRDSLVERTTPALSPVMFNLLELILGAARDIASIKDVLSGEGSNNGQVGTTLALIEQGLQVFTAIYKRVYRGLKGEFELLFRNIREYATQETAADYMELLDDPEADFMADFAAGDMDIRPVSDPASVTKMQRMARAQYLLGTVPVLAQVGGDAREALRRAYEAADIEDIDKLLPDPQPNPMQEMAAKTEMENKQADTQAKLAKAKRDEAEAMAIEPKLNLDAMALQNAGEKMVRDMGLQADKLNLEAMKAGLNAGIA